MQLKLTARILMVHLVVNVKMVMTVMGLHVKISMNALNQSTESNAMLMPSVLI